MSEKRGNRPLHNIVEPPKADRMLTVLERWYRAVAA